MLITADRDNLHKIVVLNPKGGSGKTTLATNIAAYYAMDGRPVCLRSDSGPELVSHAVQNWLKDKHVGAHYIEPGSPWQNAYNESFNSIFRITCLDRWLFGSRQVM